MIRNRAKVSIVLGTRPEIIKMAPLIAILADQDEVAFDIVFTGQHMELASTAFDAFGIQPNVNLRLMAVAQSITVLQSRLLCALELEFSQLRPSCVVVHGDTTSAFIGALAAFNLGIRVAHVEAGLRTYNLQSPFPEEANRQLISRIATLHFAPTELAAGNLLAEAVDPETVFVTGNTGIDALRHMVLKLRSDAPMRDGALEDLSSLLGFDPSRTDYVLVTAHRRENLNGGIVELCRGITDILGSTDLRIVVCTHPNPGSRRVFEETLGGIEGVSVIPDQRYDRFVLLLLYAASVLTDSGGLQEEAVTLGVPTVVFRDHTERSEALGQGRLALVRCSSKEISSAIITTARRAQKGPSELFDNTFGDGRASERIFATLKYYLAGVA